MRLSALLLAFALSGSAWAFPVAAGDASSASQDSTSSALCCQGPPARAESVGSMVGRKFTRGLTNALTGLGEIPRQIIAQNRSDESAFISVPTGFFTGLVMCVVRTGYGAFEVGTFILPFDGTYDSLLKPDYVWGPFDAPEANAK